MDNLKKINGNKDLYDRMCSWLADCCDTTMLMEAYPETLSTQDEVNAFLMDEANDIFNDIYILCQEEAQDDVEGVPV
tara:strand:+ start:118 stop:348 length:231 start_codon:yes stop_codon:yes gene_type:complete